MKRKSFILIILLLIGWVSSIQAGNVGKNYTVIVSLDGFRWDYPLMYDTPNLNSMAHDGVQAVMYPSYPASTFPNHYTIATGLVPDHHGIVNNTFWDVKRNCRYSMGDDATRRNPGYYLGEPIWVTAQKQGVKTGNVYWVGSDIPIKGTYPTYLKVWDKNLLTFEQRVDTAVAMFKKPENDRPHLVMVYFEEPDGNGHHYGPHSPQVKSIVYRVDSIVGMLRSHLAALPIGKHINLIVVSDHGMTEISKDRVVNPSKYLKKQWYTVMDGHRPTSIFTKPACRDSVYNALKNVKHIHVWKKESMPANLHYGTSDRIGDIVVAPDLGWQFTDRVESLKGAHGYFPQYSDMQVIFRAVGPDFKEGYKAKKFTNVDIYPLLAHLLHVVPAKTDGNFDEVKDMLK